MLSKPFDGSHIEIAAAAVGAFGASTAVADRYAESSLALSTIGKNSSHITRHADTLHALSIASHRAAHVPYAEQA